MSSNLQPAPETKRPMNHFETKPVRASFNPSSFLRGMFDNPIFIKHMRTRLRYAQLMPAGVVVVVLCLIIAYGGYATNGFPNGKVFGWLVSLQGIILAIMGATQIAGSIGSARESGIIDYHRVTPMSPLALALGFFFGAPIREYLLYALTLPLAVLCILSGAPTFWDYLTIAAATFTSAWLLHALALLTALSTKKPKAGGRGGIALVIFLLMFGGNLGFMFLRRGFPLMIGNNDITFYGREIPTFAFTLLYSLPALFFLLLAAVRKMRSERAHPYTKPEVIAALTTLAVLILGTVWGLPDSPNPILVLVYAMTVAACILITTVTPNAGEYAKGVRRAQREGRGRFSPWADWSLNRLTVVACAAVVMIASSLVAAISTNSVRVAANGIVVPEYSYSITIVTALFVVVYIGMAFQAFLLISPKRGTTMFALFLFFAWLVPLLVGAISSVSGLSSDASQFVMALSPVAGLSFSAGVALSESTRLFQAAALCPAIGFAFLFNNLVVIHRRKIELSLREPKEAKMVDPEQLFVIK